MINMMIMEVPVNFINPSQNRNNLLLTLWCRAAIEYRMMGSHMRYDCPCVSDTT